MPSFKVDLCKAELNNWSKQSSETSLMKYVCVGRVRLTQIALNHYLSQLH